jgi:hypothetical protein
MLLRGGLYWYLCWIIYFLPKGKWDSAYVDAEIGAKGRDLTPFLNR